MIPARAGFTLLEVLAAVVLTSIVLTAASAMYINLSNATNAAVEKTQGGRHAAALLDRVARDLEGSFLVVKPEGTDPLEHPWVFLGEDRAGAEGAERLKFVTFHGPPRATAGHAWDLSLVTYQLEPSDEEGYRLLRSASSRLPEGLDRSFPDPGDPEVLVLAEGVSDFSARFLTEEGEWKSDWDSSQLVDSGKLPLAAELSVALLSEDAELDPFAAADAQVGYVRSVILPVRPIDLEKMLEGDSAGVDEDDEEDEDGDDEDGDDFDDDDGLGGDGESADEGGMTVGECIALNRAQLLAIGATEEQLQSFSSNAPAPATYTIAGVTIQCF